MSVVPLAAAGVRLQVAVDAPQHSGISGPLDYLSERLLAPGTLVRVPLGRRELTGIVWPGGAESAGVPLEVHDLRPVGPALDDLPPLSAAWCALVSFTAAYYQRSIGEVALSVLPPALKELDAKQLQARLKKLAKWEAAEVSQPGTPSSPPSLPTLSPAQAEVLAQLDALLLSAGKDGAQAPVLLYGVTGSGKTEVYLRAAEHALQAGRQVLVLVPEINLTPQLEARFGERFAGRRIVAMHSGLTPAQRLKHWLSAHLGQAELVLGTRLAVFASMPRLGLIVVDEEHDPSYKQQDGARYSARDLAVYRAHLEKVPVLLGSATPSLESWQRAQPVSPTAEGRQPATTPAAGQAVLGSGPANAMRGRYRLLKLPERIGGGAMPRVRLFDMNSLERKTGVTTAISAPLLQALRLRLERGEQSLIFLNRRGYAPVLHCGECNWKSECAHCSAYRVFHKGDRTLRCHHCGFTERVPRACPNCGNLDIAPLGRGTERLEEQLAQMLPGARVARIDADSTRLKGSLETQLNAVHAGEVDILVGTQMITKGHDFRRITLVAAVNPDAALFSSDFRAPERLFALLMQAGGRAGRDAAQAARSEMWVQTWHPQHALFQALVKHDFEAFAKSQLAERESAGLPPFAHLALLRAEARTVEAAQAFLEAAALQAQTLPDATHVLVYPPVPMSVARVANVERLQMLIEAGHRVALQRLLAQWIPELHALKRAHKGVLRWAVDVDPLAI